MSFPELFRRGRVARWGAALLLLLIAAGAVVDLALRSEWFASYLRDRVLAEVRAIAGEEPVLEEVRFDRSTMTIRLRGFALRGGSRADEPPLARFSEARLGLRFDSWVPRGARLRSVEIEGLEVHLRTDASGANLPAGLAAPEDEGGVAWSSSRFVVQDGRLEWNGRVHDVHVEAEGVDLEAEPRGGGCYGAALAAETARGRLGDREREIQEARGRLEICRDRVSIAEARLRAGAAEIDFEGELASFDDPRLAGRYRASGAIEELFEPDAPWRIRGAAILSGDLSWSRASGLAAPNGRAEIERVEVVGPSGAIPIFSGSGATANYDLVSDVVELAEIEAAVLGGSLRGGGRLENIFDAPRYRMRGDLRGLRLNPTMKALALLLGLTPTGDAPWTADIDGDFELTGQGADALAEARARLGLVEGGARPLEGSGRLAYRTADRTLSFEDFDLNSGGARIAVDGWARTAGGADARLELDAAGPEGWRPIVEWAGIDPDAFPLGIAIAGPLRARGRFSVGSLTAVGEPSFEGRVETGAARILDLQWDSVEANVLVDRERLRLSDARLRAGGGSAEVDLQAVFNGDAFEDAAIDGTVKLDRLDIAKILRAADLPPLAEGKVGGTVQVAGTPRRPEVRADLEAPAGSIRGLAHEGLALTASLAGARVEIERATAKVGSATLQGDGFYEMEAREFRIRAGAADWPIAAFPMVAEWKQPPDGSLAFSVEAYGRLGEDEDQLFEALRTEGQWRAAELRRGESELGSWQGYVTTEGDFVRIEWSGDPLGGSSDGLARLRFDGSYEGLLKFREIDPQAAAALAGFEPENLSGAAAGEMTFKGRLQDPASFSAEGLFEDFQLKISEIAGVEGGYAVWNPFPMRWSYSGGAMTLEHMRLQGDGTDFEVDGSVGVGEDPTLDLALEGDLNLAVLESYRAGWRAAGRSSASVKIQGTASNPLVEGRLSIRDGALRSGDFPNGLSAVNGEITMSGRELRVTELTAVSGGGVLTVGGLGHFEADSHDFRFNVDVERVRLRYPENVSSAVDGRLVLSGADGRGLISGEIAILRASVAADASIGDLLAALRETSVASPAGGFLENIQLNVQVVSGPRMDIETRLVRNIQADVDLRVVGTALNPAMLGRINVTQGQMNFQGSRYIINRGVISFVNPVRVEPTLDFELETRIRDVDIALILSGPARKLNVSYRSDPPLPFADLVNLVAVGRAPNFDPVAASQQRLQQQSLFQSGANTVFSQAVERPVSPGLQRFFGVSRLKVDPQAAGAEADSATRISTEQPITNEITLIYTYDLASTQRQTVRLEYAPKRRWTFVLTRDQNGLVGSDVLFKLRRP